MIYWNFYHFVSTFADSWFFSSSISFTFHQRDFDELWTYFEHSMSMRWTGEWSDWIRGRVEYSAISEKAIFSLVDEACVIVWI